MKKDTMMIAKYNKIISVLLLIISGITYGCGSKDITGVVQDPFGNGLDGVNISIINSSFKATTDKDGEYSIDYVPGQFTVKYSKQGYTTIGIVLNINQKMKFPSDIVILYPIPEEKGLYYVGKSELIKIPPARTLRNDYSSRVIDKTINPGNLMIEPGTAKFIDTLDDKQVVFARLNESLWIQDRSYSWTGDKYFYNGIDKKNKDEIQKIGEEQLLVRSVKIEPGYYTWVTVGKNLFQNVVIMKDGYNYPFMCGYSPNDNSEQARFGLELFEAIKNNDTSRLSKLFISNDELVELMQANSKEKIDQQKLNKEIEELKNNNTRVINEALPRYHKLFSNCFADGDDNTCDPKSMQYVGLIPLHIQQRNPETSQYIGTRMIIKNGESILRLTIDNIVIFRNKTNLMYLSPGVTVEK